MHGMDSGSGALWFTMKVLDALDRLLQSCIIDDTGRAYSGSLVVILGISTRNDSALFSFESFYFILAHLEREI